MSDEQVSAAPEEVQPEQPAQSPEQLAKIAQIKLDCAQRLNKLYDDFVAEVMKLPMLPHFAQKAGGRFYEGFMWAEKAIHLCPLQFNPVDPNAGAAEPVEPQPEDVGLVDEVKEVDAA